MHDDGDRLGSAATPDDRWQRLAGVLEEAQARTAADREAYVRQACGSDTVLRREIQSLLEADAAPDGPVDRLLVALSWSRAPEHAAGDRIGPYELLKVIGRGGMGVVYLARRADGQYERLVALKVARATLLDSHVRERFLAERDILAGLSHPNIATLFDGGVTPDGHSYFTMEYVEGQPIDVHCDEMRLDVRARLRLFARVCDAVAEAHRGLVVHRDLKPNNVFVTADGRVKLLDFGIAKLLATEGYQDVASTTVDGRLMTLEYASPEQVTGRRVSTGTDVYALGLLLYELVCGRRAHRFRSSALGEIHDVIVRDDPMRPSEAALCVHRDDRAGTPETIAHARATTPARLARLLRGDLDRIVAMALRKEPARRYVSASQLAEDIDGYLAGRPVRARSASWSYRLVKFVGRHRVALMAAAALVAGVTGYLAGHLDRTHRQAVEMQRAAERARLEATRAAKVSGILTGILTGTDPYASRREQWPTAREIVDAGAERIQAELAGEPELQAEMLTVIGRTYQRLGVYDKAQSLLEKALAIAQAHGNDGNALVARSLNDLGALHSEMGDYRAAIPLLERALDLRRALLGDGHTDVAVTLVELGRACTFAGTPHRAEPLFEEALAIRTAMLGDAHKDTASSKSDLGLARWRRGDLTGAEALFREALATNMAVLGEDHPDVAASLSNIGLVMADRGDYLSAERIFRRTVAVRRRAVGATHPAVSLTLNNLANALRAQKRLDEAAAVMDEALHIAQPVLGDRHPSVAMYMAGLGRLRLERGEPGQAEPLLRRALAIRQSLFRDDDGRVVMAKSLLGQALTSLGRYGEAEPLLLQAHHALRRKSGPAARDARENTARLVALYTAWGRPADADRYRSSSRVNVR